MSVYLSIEDFEAIIIILNGSCDVVRYGQWHVFSTQDMTDSTNLEMKHLKQYSTLIPRWLFYSRREDIFHIIKYIFSLL